MAKILFTKEGLDKVNADLKDLQTKRVGYVENLRLAREMGDLSENAAYKVARQKLSQTDSRIRYLNKVVSSSRVVENRRNGTVEIGSYIRVSVNGVEQEFQIVGSHESDIPNKKISFFSPVGSALLNKRVGEMAHVNTPNGVVQYNVLSIS